MNIWGKLHCELPNGGLCHSCCVLKAIPMGFFGEIKPELSPCLHQNSELGKGSGGCSLHNHAKPSACRKYHCSQESFHHRIELISTALALGQVSKDEALSAAKMQYENSGSTFTELGKDEVLRIANRYSKLIRRRDFIDEVDT